MNAPENDSIICWRGTIACHCPNIPHYCYLLHFDQPWKHARHYLGMTGALEFRLQRHRNGNGARLMEVVSEAGISWEVARLWPCEDYAAARELEHKLKRTHGHGPALCPICRGKPVDVYTSLRQGHWPLALHARVGRRQPMNEPQFTMVK